MKITRVWFLALGIALLPFTARATEMSSPNEMSVSNYLADDGETPAPKAAVVAVKITNIGRHPATLTQMVADYRGGESEVHDLANLVLKHGDNVVLNLAANREVVRTTVYFHGRTRLMFEYLTAVTPQPIPEPQPMPQPEPQPEPIPAPVP